MTLGTVVAIAYGILAILGGIMGYVKVRSRPSLISGLISGALLILGAALWAGEYVLGQGIALVVTLGLILVFIDRLRKTRKFMPAGLMIIVGILAFIVMVMSSLQLPST